MSRNASIPIINAASAATGTTSFGATAPRRFPSPSTATNPGLSEESFGKLLAMTKARRSGGTMDLKVTKKVPELTGRADFIHWRTMLLGMFVPYLGGRYWHLLEKDPATSLASYRFIFGTQTEGQHDIALCAIEEAAMERDADLVAIHGLILQTLSPAIVAGLDEGTTAGAFDGIKLWDALVAKYGGKDFGTLRAAKDAIQAFRLNGRTVAQASQDLQALYTEIYLASGGIQVDEDDKIETLLAVFNVPPYQALRATIHENWQNGHPYTYDTIVSRFTGEESLQRLAAVADGTQTSTAAALQTQTASTNHTTAQGQGRGIRSGGQRQGPANQRRSECWWCAKANHKMNTCRRRLAGEGPHPASKAASDRARGAQGPDTNMIYPQTGQNTSMARLAALERNLTQVTALLTAAAHQRMLTPVYSAQNAHLTQTPPIAFQFAGSGSSTAGEEPVPGSALYGGAEEPHLH